MPANHIGTSIQPKSLNTVAIDVNLLIPHITFDEGCHIAPAGISTGRNVLTLTQNESYQEILV